jgi:hypothetical protein
MLYEETVAVYCENHTEHTDTLCGQNANFCSIEAGGTYCYGHGSAIHVPKHRHPVPRYNMAVTALLPHVY